MQPFLPANLQIDQGPCAKAQQCGTVSGQSCFGPACSSHTVHGPAFTRPPWSVLSRPPLQQSSPQPVDWTLCALFRDLEVVSFVFALLTYVLGDESDSSLIFATRLLPCVHREGTRNPGLQISTSWSRALSFQNTVNCFLRETAPRRIHANNSPSFFNGIRPSCLMSSQ
jgi:hypothetical protein